MTNRKARGKDKIGKSVLQSLDMDKTIAPKDYFRKLEELQNKLREIQQAYIFSTEAAAIVFEGWDTAGKGGTIRRITSALDARSVKVWPIASPREYYKERHYLARFWERLPPNGAISIFDRSWYGRVLVERVEGFAQPDEWKRAYREINEFEKVLTDDGTRILKFFLHITPDEQLKRFEQRLKDPLKRWKLQYEDFRNREKWDAYEEAIEDMLEKTSTKYAPWHVIPANDKKYARLDVIKRACKQLSAGVDLSPRPLDAQTLAAARKYFDLDL
jgi:polyphosphate kinase 2 (PPK2 family)